MVIIDRMNTLYSNIYDRSKIIVILMQIYVNRAGIYKLEYDPMVEVLCV